MKSRVLALGLVLLSGPASASTHAPRSAPAALAQARQRLRAQLRPCGERWCLPGGYVYGAQALLEIYKNRGAGAHQGELWLFLKRAGRYELYKRYPIARYHAEWADAARKARQGDGRSPEGFYLIERKNLNPHSQYHLAIDTGYPSTHDRKAGRTGGDIMIHGGASSAGCFAMGRDERGIERVEEIYALVEAAFDGGQPTILLRIDP